MTNKEKAEEIANTIYTEWKESRKTAWGAENGARIMAKWKDEIICSMIPQIITCVHQGITQCAPDEVIIKGITNLIKKTENYEEIENDSSELEYKQMPNWHKTSEGIPQLTDWDWRYYVAKLKSDYDNNYAPKRYRMFAGRIEESDTVMGIIDNFVWTDSIHDYVNFDNVEAWLELPE